MDKPAGLDVARLIFQTRKTLPCSFRNIIISLFTFFMSLSQFRQSLLVVLLFFVLFVIRQYTCILFMHVVPHGRAVSGTSGVGKPCYTS